VDLFQFSLREHLRIASLTCTLCYVIFFIQPSPCFVTFTWTPALSVTSTVFVVCCQNHDDHADGQQADGISVSDGDTMVMMTTVVTEVLRMFVLVRS
jgi:hypothetical protein